MLIKKVILSTTFVQRLRKMVNGQRSMVNVILLLFSTAVLTSCIDDNDAVETETMSIPVNLYIPVNQDVMTKTPGDPGTYEQFALPEYIYIYLVLNYNQGGTNKTAIFKIDENLDPTKWGRKELYSGPFSQVGDYIYRYNGNLVIELPTGITRHWGHVYAAVSKEELDINDDGIYFYPDNTYTGEGIYDTYVEADPNRDPAIRAVRNLTFTLAEQTSLQNSLQNLYSTPYNYRIDEHYTEDPSGNYYGTVSGLDGNVPHVDLMLYHVAAKIDLIWNVDPHNQSDIRLTKITAENQFGGNAYLFRPMENVRSNDDGAYNKDIIVNDIGSQWMGRAYYYTIPFRDSRTSNTFNIRMRLQKNADTSHSYLPEFRKAIDATSPFTPWVRGDLTFSFADAAALDAFNVKFETSPTPVGIAIP